jgi:hypothetical protein
MLLVVLKDWVTDTNETGAQVKHRAEDRPIPLSRFASDRRCRHPIERPLEHFGQRSTHGLQARE